MAFWRGLRRCEPFRGGVLSAVQIPESELERGATVGTIRHKNPLEREIRENRYTDKEALVPTEKEVEAGLSLGT